MARMFKQLAQGYGTGTLSATVQLDGQVIFDGPVPTIDALPPGPTANVVLGVDCWHWQEDINYQGSKTLTIVVAGSGMLQLNQTMALANVEVPDSWVAVYNELITTPLGDDILSDPLSNVTIDGVLQTRSPEFPLNGQWSYNIFGGQTFTATFTVNITGNKPNPPR